MKATYDGKTGTFSIEISTDPVVSRVQNAMDGSWFALNRSGNVVAEGGPVRLYIDGKPEFSRTAYIQAMATALILMAGETQEDIAEVHYPNDRTIWQRIAVRVRHIFARPSAEEAMRLSNEEN